MDKFMKSLLAVIGIALTLTLGEGILSEQVTTRTEGTLATNAVTVSDAWYTGSRLLESSTGEIAGCEVADGSQTFSSCDSADGTINYLTEKTTGFATTLNMLFKMLPVLITLGGVGIIFKAAMKPAKTRIDPAEAGLMGLMGIVTVGIVTAFSAAAFDAYAAAPGFTAGTTALVLLPLGYLMTIIMSTYGAFTGESLARRTFRPRGARGNLGF